MRLVFSLPHFYSLRMSTMISSIQTLSWFPTFPPVFVSLRSIFLLIVFGKAFGLWVHLAFGFGYHMRRMIGCVRYHFSFSYLATTSFLLCVTIVV
jgi:hypothetical protein